MGMPCHNSFETCKLIDFETDGDRGMDKNMEEKIFELHAEVCKSMASPTRLKIMDLLREGEKPVEELRKRLRLPKANLSQHLGVLRQRGIISSRRSGLNIYYKVTNSKMIKACDLLREVLLEQIREDGKLVKGIR
jgi:ArsR family transcriptional regulator